MSSSGSSLVSSTFAGISILAPNRPTAYTLRGLPVPYLLVAWDQRLGTGPGLPQRESLNI